MKILIDNGHGVETPGKRSPDGRFREYAYNRLIARAIVHDPETLVFDEPCTGLDPQGMFYVRHSLRELARAGKSLLLVTHYPEDVIPEVERLVMIKDGVVFADGPKEELMTSAQMSALFDVPMEVREEHGYYQLVAEY